MPEKRNNFEKTHAVPAERLFPRLLDYWRTRKRLCMKSDIFVEHALYGSIDTILNPGLMAVRLVQRAQL